MKIRDVDGVCIVDIEKNVVSQSELKKIRQCFKDKSAQKRIGINLDNVSFLDYDFINFLKEASLKQKISIFNANTDIYLFLFISQADKYANIYLDSADFIADKNLVVYRRFKLLKSA